MMILAWNCRGMGSSLAVCTLADEVKTKDPLLIFLVETKTGESRMRGLGINWSTSKELRFLATAKVEGLL